MSIGTGIVMLVIGAVLRFAITLPNAFIDLGTVGVILMGAGFIALAIGIFVAIRPRSTVETVVRNRADALPPTRPYDSRQ
jgi:hypothetical protein